MQRVKRIKHYSLVYPGIHSLIPSSLSLFRTFLEQACHIQMDGGKNMAAKIGAIMEAPQKALMWQFQDGKYDGIIVWDSE